MKAIMGLMTVFTIPLMVLNVLGGIVSGVWLAIIGDWAAIGLGIGLFFFSTMLLGIAMMPSVLLVAGTSYFSSKRSKLGFICFGILGNGYVLTVVTLWCCAMLYLFMHDANE